MINKVEFEQLIQKRKRLIEAHKDNDFTDGIQALLTDLYPDTAHFIYELLQNAEDMDATTVRFDLNKDGIGFEHNGTKRTFNYNDVDAITSIGHNVQKKDDPTSIGKFGVGFKAVFAYTATPIIHSGNAHFKIEDYFVPNLDVEQVDTVDGKDVDWTKFYFPFNKPSKPKQVAFQECLDGLKALNDSAILFMRNIRQIEYIVSDRYFGWIKREDKENHHVTVSYKSIDDSKEKQSSWLRFDRFVDIDSANIKKHLPISVAFALAYDKKTGVERIVPVKDGGKTFIYFPAEKEYSGLWFHINAPFASTVARDSVRDCEDNKKLIECIAQLIVDTLPKIKEYGLMNHSFFRVLPNQYDGISPFYKIIPETIFEAFKYNDYLPIKSGGYASSTNAIKGPVAISSLINDDDVAYLFKINKRWIINAQQKNSRTDDFLNSLEISELNNCDILKLFSTNCRENTEKFLRHKRNDVNWFVKFYMLCAQIRQAYCNHEILIEDMKKMRYILSQDNELYRPNEIFILPPNVELLTNVNIVHPQIFNSRNTEEIQRLFRYLSIEEYGPKVEIERLLDKYNKSAIIFDDEYFSNVLAFAKYGVEHDDVAFNEYGFLQGVDRTSLVKKKIPELILGEKYGNPNGRLLSEAYQKPCLWNGYKQEYDKEQLKIFIEFLKKYEIQADLKIEWQAPYKHPLFSKKLSSPGRVTRYGAYDDWTIPNLEELLQKKSFEISKLIWKSLEVYGKSLYREGDSTMYFDSHGLLIDTRVKYIRASYAPNGTAAPKSCDSSLMYYLKWYKWVPDKNKVLHRPCDLDVSEIHPDFKYDDTNIILRNLDFSHQIEEKEESRKQLESEAEKQGYFLAPKDEKEEYAEFKRLKEQQRENAEQKSIKVLLENQNKKAIDKSGASISSNRVKEQDIEDTFKDAAKMNVQVRKMFSKISGSTKEEKNLLQAWYGGACQMCAEIIIKNTGEPHFIAVNFIGTQSLSNEIYNTVGLGWNSISLCPNCAARYKVCTKDMSEAYEQIINAKIPENPSDYVALEFELDGRERKIHYTADHFKRLQTATKIIDKEFVKD